MSIISGLTRSSSPRLAYLNSIFTFLGPMLTTCVKRLDLGMTCEQERVENRSRGIVGKSWPKKSVTYKSISSHIPIPGDVTRRTGSIVPPARITLRAESTTSLNRSAGFRRMYFMITMGF
jgi:hypothetical protein